jgi:hypothetical protein
VLFEDEAGLLAGAGVAAGLPAGAADSLLGAGAGADLLAGGELAAGAVVAGAAAVESAAVALFDLLFWVVDAAPPVSVVLFWFGAELSAASAAVLFFERDFFVAVSGPLVFAVESAVAVLLSAVSEVALFFERGFFAAVAASDPLVFAVESAVGALLAVELSGASAAVLLFFERLFLVVAAELSDAAASVPAAAFFLDLEVLVLVESAVASGLVCEASEVAAFFFAFFLVLELVSVWSVEPDEPDCCAARTVTLPKISSMATARANRTPLLALIWPSPPPVTAVRP